MFSTMALEVENETVQLFVLPRCRRVKLLPLRVPDRIGHNRDQCCRSDRDRPNIQGLISGGRGLKLLKILKSRQHCCS